jgi:hypothetical protein
MVLNKFRTFQHEPKARVQLSPCDICRWSSLHPSDAICFAPSQYFGPEIRSELANVVPIVNLLLVVGASEEQQGAENKGTKMWKQVRNCVDLGSGLH